MGAPGLDSETWEVQIHTVAVAGANASNRFGQMQIKGGVANDGHTALVFSAASLLESRRAPCARFGNMILL